MYAPASPAKPRGPFDVSHLAPKDVEVWPENWPACLLMDDIGSQWLRGGMDGTPIALDYGVLFTRMSQLGLSPEEHEAMFQDIRLMEREALRVMNQN